MRYAARSLNAFVVLATIVSPISAAQQSSDRPVSPDVLPDDRVTLRIHAPNAHEVTVWGDWVAQGLGKVEHLTKDESGFWNITVGPLPPDYYVYAYKVDGLRVADPMNPLSLRGSYSILRVPGETVTFSDNQDVPHGHVRQVWYRSSTLGTQRRLHVYTPPGYDQDDRVYPTLYLLHGRGGDDSGWITKGRAGFIMDNLLAESKAVPMLVVMPNGSLPRSVSFSQIVPEVLNDIVPLIEDSFRVHAASEKRAIAGNSMGGAQALRIASNDYGQFDYVGAWGTFAGLREDSTLLSNAEDVNQRLRLLSITVGERDSALQNVKELSDLLRQHDINHELDITAGGHTMVNWRRYLHDYAQRLFR